MFEILRKIWRTGTVTRRQPLPPAAAKYRGKIVIDPERCNGCLECIGICPSGALRTNCIQGKEQLVISHEKCIFCGSCADNCAEQAIKLTNQCYLATRNKQEAQER